MKKPLYFSAGIFVLALFFRTYQVNQCTPVLYDEGILIQEYYFCRDAIDIGVSGILHGHSVSSILQDCKKQLVYPYPKDGKYFQPIIYALSSYLLGRTAYVPAYINAIAGAFTAVGLAYLAWWFYGETAALAAGLLAAVWSGLILYDRSSMGESLPILFFVCGIIAFCLSQRKTLLTMVEGAALGLMFCCNARYIYILVIFVALEYLYLPQSRELIKKRLFLLSSSYIFTVLLGMSPFLAGFILCAIIGIPYPVEVNPLATLLKQYQHFDRSISNILVIRYHALGFIRSYFYQIYGIAGGLLQIISFGYLLYRRNKEDRVIGILLAWPFLFWILIQGFFLGRFIFPITSVAAILAGSGFYSFLVSRNRFFYLLFAFHILLLLIFGNSLMAWKSANTEVAQEYPHLFSSNYNIINALKGGGKALEWIDNQKRMPAASLPKNLEDLTYLYQHGYTVAAVDCLYEIDKKGKIIYPPLADMIECTQPIRTYEHPIGAAILFPMEHNLEYESWVKNPTVGQIRLFDLGKLIHPLL